MSQAVSPKFSALADIKFIVEICAFTFVNGFFFVSCKICETRDTIVVKYTVVLQSSDCSAHTTHTHAPNDPTPHAGHCHVVDFYVGGIAHASIC